MAKKEGFLSSLFGGNNEEPIEEQVIPQEPETFNPNPEMGGKDVYQYHKNRFLSDERLWSLDDDTKRDYLGKFYDKYGVDYLKQSGIDDPNTIKEFRQKFVLDNFSKIPDPRVKKKEEQKQARQEREEFIQSLPDWSKEPTTYEQNISKQDAIQPLKQTTSLFEDDRLQAEQFQKEEQERLQSQFTEKLPELLSNDRFGYIDSRPEVFIEIGADGGKEVNKWLKDQEIPKADRRYFLQSLNEKAEYDWVQKMKSEWDPEELEAKVKEEAAPYIDGIEPGTFLDTETGKRKNEPETDSDAEYMSLLDASSNKLLQEMFSTVEDPEFTLLNEERLSIDKEYEVLFAKQKEIEDWVTQQSVTTPEEETAFKDEYNKMYDEYRDMADKFTEKQSQFSEKIDKYNDNLKDSGRIEEITTNKVTKDKLQDVVNDSYLKMKHWENRVKQIQEGGIGDNQGDLLLNAQSKLKESRAMFEAGSRMLYANQGPMDVDKDAEYKFNIFTDSFSKAFLGDDLSSYNDPIDRDIMQKMVDIGLRSDVEWTDEEAEHIKATTMEHVADIGGMLSADLPMLLLLGGGAGIIKSSDYVKGLKNGYKIIRKIVGKGEKGKAIKSVIGYADDVPMGWEVLKESAPTTLSKAKALTIEVLLDEAVFTGLGGFQPGMMSGMTASHYLLPDLKLKGKYGAILQPYIEAMYKSGVGATVGMEAGGISAAAVDALFKDTDFGEQMKAMYPSMDEAGTRVIAEFMVNSVIFGGMGAAKTSFQKQATAPIGAKNTKYGNANWTAYISPKYRAKVYDTAKQADAAGYTETAKSLYRWLDMTKEPITGEQQKKQRMEDLEKISEVLPIGTLRQHQGLLEESILQMEAAGRNPDFEGSFEFNMGTHQALKLGRVIEHNGNYYEITGIEKNKSGEQVNFKLMDVETGEGLSLNKADFDPTVKYRVNSPMELNARIEQAYERLEAVNKQIAKKGYYGEQAALNRGPDPLTPLPEGTGEYYIKPKEPTKVEKRLKEIEEREQEITEAGGEPIELPDQLKKEYRFGDPGKMPETNVLDFRKKIDEEYFIKQDAIKEHEDTISGLQEQLKGFSGRLDLNQRKERQSIQDEISRQKTAIDKIEANYDKELNDFLNESYEGVLNEIKSISPDITDEQVTDLMDNIWEHINTPVESDKGKTLKDIIQEETRDFMKDGKPIESKKEPRKMTAEGRAEDDGPILPGNVFQTLSGRTTTPYPKYSTKRDTKKDRRAASEWMIENAIAEAESRGDDYNVTLFKAITISEDGTITQAESESINMYLFESQPDVPKPILKDVKVPEEKENLSVEDMTTARESTLMGTVDTANRVEKILEDATLEDFVEKIKADNIGFSDIKQATGIELSDVKTQEDFDNLIDTLRSRKAEAEAELKTREDLPDLKEGEIRIGSRIFENTEAFQKFVEEHPNPADIDIVDDWTPEKAKIITNEIEKRSGEDFKKSVRGKEKSIVDDVSTIDSIPFIKKAMEDMSSNIDLSMRKSFDMGVMDAIKEKYPDVDEEKQIEIYQKVIKDFMEGDLPKKKFPKTLTISPERYYSDKYGLYNIGKVNVKPIPYKKQSSSEIDPVKIAKTLEKIVSRDELRPVMMGVFYDVKNNKMVATDAHRLVAVDVELSGNEKIVDPKTGKIYEGNFPAYDKVTPHPDDAIFTQTISSTDIPAFLSRLSGLNKLLDFTEPTSNIAEPKMIVPATIEYEGERAKYYPRNMFEAVEALYLNIGNSDMEMFYYGPEKPLVFRSKQTPGTYALIMPVMRESGNYNDVLEKYVPNEETQPVKEPEIKETIKKPKQEPIKPIVPELKETKADIDDDLREMKDLLDDLPFDAEDLSMGGNSNEETARVKMGQAATRIIEKYTGVEVYSFPEIIKDISNKIDHKTMKKLLPFLKQSYAGYWTVAPDEVGEKMNIKEAKEYDNNNLEKVYNPVEEKPKEPRYNDKEWNSTMEKYAPLFEDINMPKKATEIRNKIGIEPESEFERETEINYIKNLYSKAKRLFELETGKEMLEVFSYSKVTPEEMLNALELRAKGDPISPVIREHVPKDKLEEIAKLESDLSELLGKTGELGKDKENNLVNLWYQGVYGDISVIPQLYKIGTAPDEKVLNRELKHLDKAIKKGREKLEQARIFSLRWNIKYNIWNNKPMNRFTDLVNMGETWGIDNKKIIRETAEAAMVDIARTYSGNVGLTPEEAYGMIVNIYTDFPTLTYRTNDIKEKQQYSTPVPIGYVMGGYINGKEVDRILEPSAGNGSLLINTSTLAVTANDIDPVRYKNLADAGYQVTKYDTSGSLDGFWSEKFDALLMNPPFGGPGGEIAGFPMTGEYYTVANSLQQLKPTGKAAIIVGGHIEFDDRGRMKGKDLRFFNWLGKYFNIEDIIQINGDLYGTMGTRYPIKLILVNGLKASPEGAAPLHNDSFDVVNNWPELFERVNSLITKPNEKNTLRSKMDADRKPGDTVGRRNPGTGTGEDRGTTGDVPTEEVRIPDTTGRPGGSGQPDERLTPRDPGERPRGDGTPDIEPPKLPGTEGRTGGEGTRSPGLRNKWGQLQPKAGEGDIRPDDTRKPTERNKRDIGLKEREADETVPYTPLSEVTGEQVVVPASMSTEIEDALIQLQDEVGNIDEYVIRKLNLNNKTELEKAFFPHQVDGIGLGIFNIENGDSIIIGDQTGTGKGRIAAGIITYAIENNKIPIFVTKSADLFSDIYRDLIGIDRGQYNPMILNRNFPTGSEKAKIYHPVTGEVMYETDPSKVKRAVDSREFPEEYDLILATYSQFNTAKGNSFERREFLKSLGSNAIFILDESHLASGQSNTGRFFIDFIQGSGGGIFLSATFAKRPDNMPVYAMKTVMREANMTNEELIEAIEAGGPALQEILSANLVESMQFTRRGLQMEGVEVNYLVLGDTDPESPTYNPELGETIRKRYDGVTKVMHEIIQFQKRHIKPVIDGMDQLIKEEGKEIAERLGVSSLGVNNQPYFSKVFNVIDQLLLASKVREVLPYIIKDLQEGRKPVISLRNTMESMFNEMNLDYDQEIELDFSSVLLRGLDGVFRYTETSPEGIKERKTLEVADLSEQGKAKYYNLYDKIKALTTDTPLSPIDILIKGITDAGFQVAEITGRKTMFALSDDLTRGTYMKNPKGNKNEAIRNFNNNPGWAAIINVSGSTGLSMHSSPTFKDTSQRVMYVVQNDLDINTLVQIRGRVYRADQLNKPIYNNMTSVLPAELRMFMMNKQKLKSLDANTTSNQKQSKSILDATDWLNKYGDEMVVQFLEEHPEINQMIDDPLGMLKPDGGQRNIDKAGAARKVTSRMQIAPTEIQEYFNTTITESYENYIDYLNSTGQNDLAVTSERLDAEVKSKEVAVRGLGGYSAFGDDTVLEVVEANVLRKPLTKKELDAEIENVLADRPAEEYISSIKDMMKDSMGKSLSEKLTDLSEKYEESREGLKKQASKQKGTPEDKQRWYDRKNEELTEREESQRNSIHAIHINNQNRFERYFNFFTPGRVLEVPFDEGADTGTIRISKGVFIGFDINMNKPNPFIPSNVMLKFATADSRRVFRIPASKHLHIESIISNSYNISSSQGKELLDSWDSITPQRMRETRYIITGNILQGMNQFSQGRLIQFTRKDGTVDKGILMPENWTRPVFNTTRIPISEAVNIIKALHPMDFVESIDGKVVIRKLHLNDPQRYELQVPASTKQGKEYYSDPGLSKLVKYGLFEQKGDRMVGTFEEPVLPEIAKYLYERFGTLLEVDNIKLNRGTSDSSQFESLHQKYKGPRINNPKKRKGLSNPEGATQGATGTPMGKRIEPDPITGESPKMLIQMQLNISRELGKKIRYAKSNRSGAIGSYTPSTGKLVILYQGDLNLTAHELGHYLDDLFGLVGPEAQFSWRVFKDELKEYWDYGSKPPKGHPNPEQYKMMEGVAEFIRAWLVNPNETAERSPEFYKWFKERLSKDEKVWKAMNEFSRDIRVWYGASYADKMGTNIQFGKEPPGNIPLSQKFNRTGPHGEFQLTPWDNWSQNWVNKFHPANIAFKYLMEQKGINPNDPKKLDPLENFEWVLRTHLGFNVKMEAIFNRGMITWDKKPVYDPVTKQRVSFMWKASALPQADFKETEKLRQEALRYGLAERVVEAAWKFQAKQIRADLNSGLDVLPPMDILEKHPFILDKYSGIINTIIDKLNEGELDPKDVFLPEERYDFTGAVISGIAQEGFTDYSIAEGALKELEEMKKTNPDKYKTINEYNRRYREISKSLIDYYYKAGMISTEAYEQIAAENLYYIAMNRYFLLEPEGFLENKDDLNTDLYKSGSGRKGLEPKIELYALKGSRKVIKDPDLMQIETVFRMTETADLNHIVKTFAIALVGERGSYEGTPSNLSDIGWVSRKYEPHSINFFINGKKRFLVLRNPEIHKVFKDGMRGGGKTGILGKILQLPPKILRNLIITAPPFIIRNVQRDLQHFMIVGKGHRYIRPGDVKIDDKLNEAFEIGGAGMFGFYNQNRKTHIRLMKEFMYKASKDPKKVVLNPDLLFKVSGRKIFGWMGKSERITRILQFKAAYREGIEKFGLDEESAILRAAFLTRDLLDFGVAGFQMEEINKYIIFSNAAVQGLSKIARENKNNPGSFWLKFLLFAGIPSMMVPLYLWLHGTEEQIEEYKNLPDYQRDLFYNIPMGNKWLIIPKPFEIGWAGSIFERAASYALLNEEEPYNEEWLKNSWHALFPFDMAGVTGGYSGIIGSTFNKDMFRGSYIIPPEDQEVAVTERNTENSSKIGQALQKSSGFLVEGEGEMFDARKVDAFINSQFGYYGKYALNIFESVLPGESNKKYKFSFNDLGIIRDDPVYSAPDVQFVLKKGKEFPWLRQVDAYQELMLGIRYYYSPRVQASENLKEEVDHKIREYATQLRKKLEEYDLYKVGKEFKLNK